MKNGLNRSHVQNVSRRHKTKMHWCDQRSHVNERFFLGASSKRPPLTTLGNNDLIGKSEE